MGLGVLALLLGSVLLASFLDDGNDTPDDTTKDDPLPELPEDTSTATTIEVTGPDGVETRVVEQSSDDLQNQFVVEIAEVSLGSIQTSYDYALDDYVTTGNLNANPDITTSRPVVSTLRIDNGEF